MMVSIDAGHFDTGLCPTGVTTQKPKLVAQRDITAGVHQALQLHQGDDPGGRKSHQDCR